MGKAELTLAEAQDMLVYLSRRMVESKDVLTQADKAIGDGDHGVGMARGFRAVEEKLEGQAFDGLGELLSAVGVALMMSIGGAAGAVFGTFFRGGGERLAGQRTFDARVLSVILADGLAAVQRRGGAQPDDKTMVDALEPAAQQAEALASASLAESLHAAAEAARQGMECTKDMVARVGKAKTLGQRSMGHVDPGAMSLYLILRFMDVYVTDLEGGD